MSGMLTTSCIENRSGSCRSRLEQLVDGEVTVLEKCIAILYVGPRRKANEMQVQRITTSAPPSVAPTPIASSPSKQKSAGPGRQSSPPAGFELGLSEAEPASTD